MMYKNIDLIINYFINHNLIVESDYVYFRNRLAHFLSISEDGFSSFIREMDINFYSVIEQITSNRLELDTVMKQDKFEAELVNLFLPKPSDITKCFYELYKDSAVDATDWFHHLSIITNYIKVNRINQNISYQTNSEYGLFDITFNLSKPEKDPQDIAAQTNSVKFPKCVLCEENVGFHGTGAARANHRVIPITLKGEEFLFQYSPYAYFEEHCIVLSKEHRPMQMTENTFEYLVDFIEQFPHYFIGSNASKPYVGGSILEHEHYQGGKSSFPIESAKVLTSTQYKDSRVEVLNWPMTSIRVIATDKTIFLEKVKELFNRWNNYSNKSENIYPENNAVSAMVRKFDNEYIAYLTLRNNRITEEYPLGVYHVKADKHNIKKENIGLIEVAGLAILPGRLKEEMDAVYLSIKNGSKSPEVHKSWLSQMDTKKVSSLDDLYHEVGKTFVEGLKDCEVLSKEELENFINNR